MIGKLKQILALARDASPPYGKIFAALLLSVGSTFVALWIPLLTRDFIENADQISTGLIAMLAGALVFQAASAALSLYLLGIAGHAIVANLRKGLFKKMIHLPVPFYDNQESGELTSRIVSDTNALQNLITLELVSFGSGLVRIIGSIVILFMLDWRMSLLLFGSVLAAVLVVNPIVARMSGIAFNVQKETAEFTAQLSRLLSDIRLVKASAAESFELAKGDRTVDSLFQLGRKEAGVRSLTAPIITLAMMAALVIILGYGGSRVASGQLLVGELIAFILYIFNIVLPLIAISQFFAELFNAFGASERLVDLLKQEPESDGGGAVPAGLKPLHLRDLNFHYSDESQPVLKGLDLTFEPGKVTALVGPSGAGKSTVFAMIERFYQPVSGEIHYGEAAVAGLSLNGWRRILGYVPQDSPVMSGTIRENLCYGLDRRIDDAALFDAAKKAYAHDFIMDMPDHYETQVGERGVKLSGGQRQRLAIARALLKDPKILMLDEATSSLDSQAEQMVQQALGNLMAGRTTLVIAHRLSTVVDADRIVVLEDGAVSASGTHAELMAENGLYRELVEQQFQTASEPAEPAED